MAAALPRNEQIKRNYVSPPHPSAFGGITSIARRYNISADKAAKILSEIDAYTLHREYKKPRKRNPYYVYTLRQQAQVDLIDIRGLAEHNNGISYLLVLIDCFSRKLWVYPLRNKSGNAVAAALDYIFGEMQSLPKSIFCDRGTELKNDHVKALLRRNNVTLMHPNSEIKAGIVERANRSLQNLIYRFMTDGETRTYINSLQEIVESYNSRPHRSIAHLSPHEAELPENSDKVVTALRAHYEKAITPKYVKKFKIGDKVRIKTAYGNRFARGYEEQFSREIFEVVAINSRMAIPMYRLKSLNTDEVIRGHFYQNEMQATNSDVYKVERVLRRRWRNGERECFVKWLNFSSRHNSWIKESDIVRTFDRPHNSSPPGDPPSQQERPQTQ